MSNENNTNATDSKRVRGRPAPTCSALSCPFCGGKAQSKAMTPRKYDTMAFMTVECQSCGACGPVSAGVDSKKAIRKWNDQIGWQCQHSARYLLEDKTPESVAKFTGLPLGVVVSAYENIMQNVKLNRERLKSNN